jgi:hypothetical protein
MADNEPPDEITASTTQPLPWPDPTRPIVSQQPPDYPGYQQGPGYGAPAPRYVGRRRRRWPVILAALVFLVIILVDVWYLWWR